MMSGVMGGWFAPRLLTCELSRVKAWRRLTVFERRGASAAAATTGTAVAAACGAACAGATGKNGIETSLSDVSVLKTMGRMFCMSSGILFGDSPAVKLYSDAAVGETGAVLNEPASNWGGMTISCSSELGLLLPREPLDANLSGLKAGADAAAPGLCGGGSTMFSSTSARLSMGIPGDLGLCICMLLLEFIDMAENDVPGRLAVDGRVMEFVRTLGVSDSGALAWLTADDLELMVLVRRSFDPPAEGCRAGFADPATGIGIGAGLGARNDGVSRPVISSRIEATKLGARWGAGLAERDLEDMGRGIRDEAVTADE
jgi:hypothetical protein